MPSDIHFVGWRPSPLGYNCAVGSLHAIIEKRSGLERNAWRCALHQVAIVHDIPCALMVYDTIVLEKALELWGPEQEHEIAVRVPGGKCTRNKSID